MTLNNSKLTHIHLKTSKSLQPQKFTSLILNISSIYSILLPNTFLKIMIKWQFGVNIVLLFYLPLSSPSLTTLLNKFIKSL